MLNLGKWQATQFDGGDVPTVAGISGGSTSGMMAALCSRSVVFSFQNAVLTSKFN